MNHKTKSFLCSHRGLTFIEVMYSVLLTATTLVLLSNLSSQSNTHLKRSARYSTVSHLMELKMIDIEIAYLEEGIEILEQMQEGEFEDYPDFTWSLEVQELDEFFNPLTLQEGQELSSNQPQVMDQIQMINNKFTELITEIRLTIYYKKNDQESSYSLTTYMTDFKKAQSPEFATELQNSLVGGGLEL